MKHIDDKIVIGIHIPSDADFSPCAVDKSLMKSKKFFTEYYDEKLGLLLTTFYTDDNKEVLSIHHKNEVFIVTDQNCCKVYYSYKEFVDYIERIR